MRISARKQSFKILHIRASGNAFGDNDWPTLAAAIRHGWNKPAAAVHGDAAWGLHKFSRWAFGPSGFPQLEILAYGDFSYRHGSIGPCILLGRHKGMEITNRCQFVDRCDLKDTTTVDDPWEFLQACPENSLA